MWIMDQKRVNKLKLNPEVLLAWSSASQELDYQPALEGATLPLKDKGHSLKITLDPDLNLDNKITAMAQSASY